MESGMNILKLAIIPVVFVTGCGEDNDKASECPEVIEPVIIPAVSVNF